MVQNPPVGHGPAWNRQKDRYGVGFPVGWAGHSDEPWTFPVGQRPSGKQVSSPWPQCLRKLSLQAGSFPGDSLALPAGCFPALFPVQGSILYLPAAGTHGMESVLVLPGFQPLKESIKPGFGLRSFGFDFFGRANPGEEFQPFQVLLRNVL